MSVSYISHNVNGFGRNFTCVRDLCLSLPSCIYSIQEHWLPPPYNRRHPGVNKLMTLDPKLEGWGTSAMKKKMESQIMTGKGRPFGGTGFVWSKTLSLATKPRCEYRHDQVTVLELFTNVGSLFPTDGLNV